MNALKRTLAWLLVIAMMIPGFAFAEDEQVLVIDQTPEIHVHEEPTEEPAQAEEEDVVLAELPELYPADELPAQEELPIEMEAEEIQVDELPEVNGSDCGHENAYYSWDYSYDQVYTSSTATHHYGTKTVEEIWYCPDCYSEIIYDIQTGVEFSGKHSWSCNEEEVDGVTVYNFYCYSCDYVNTCEHDFFVDYTSRDNERIVDNGDGTHDIYYNEYNRYECSICEAYYYETGSEEKLIDNEPHNWFMRKEDGTYQSYCYECEAVNPCTHDFYSESDSKYYQDSTDNGDGTHTRTYYVGYNYKCSLCGVSGWYKDVDNLKTEISGHDYNDDGECRYCGAANPCEHLNYEVNGSSRKNQFYSSEDANEEGHLVTYDLYDYCYCSDCGNWFDRLVETGVTERNSHYYEVELDSNNNVVSVTCYYCGYESTCAHNFEITSSDRYVDESEDNGDGTHSLSYREYIRYYCYDCHAGYSVYGDELIHVASEAHQWYSYRQEDGVFVSYCDVCDAENTCEHEIVLEEQYRSVESAADNGDGTHTVQYYANYAYTCTKCGMEGDYYDWDTLLTASEPHEYNWQGICYHCKAVNTCEHENVTAERTWRANTQYVEGSATATTCSYKYDLMGEGQCPDCNIWVDFVVEVGKLVENAPHSWDYDFTDAGEVRIYCNYCNTENPCDHEWYLSNVSRYDYNAWDNGDGTHTVTYIPGYSYRCDLCDAYYWQKGEESITVNDEEHEYNEDNRCRWCRAINPCSHENMYIEYTWDSDCRAVAGSITETTCSYICDVRGEGQCPDCGEWMMIIVEEDVLRENMPHEWSYRWDDNGDIVIYCDHCQTVSACEHDWYVDYEDRYRCEGVDNGDGTHDVTYTPEYRYVCSGCGASYWQETDERVTVENEPHEFYSDGYCRYCGAENTCTHENVVQDGWTEYDNIIVHAYDATGHTITSYMCYWYECQDCGQSFSETEKEPCHVEETMPHEYDEGRCWVCNYVNTCTHPNYEATYSGYNRDWNRPIISTTETTHTYWARPYVSGECPDCGEYISEITGEAVQRTEGHEYYNGKSCYLCEYVPTCTHKNTVVSQELYSYVNSSKDYKIISDSVHSVPGCIVKITTCSDCGFSTEETTSSFTILRAHNFNKLGACDCGYKSGCPHSSTYTYTYTSWTKSEYVNAKAHKDYWNEFEVTCCEACDAELSEKITGSGSVTGNHIFGAANICVDCGYISTCAHSKTSSSSKDYNRCIAVSTDKHQLYTYTWNAVTCKSCNATLEHRSSSKITLGKVAEHTNKNGYCSTCGLPEQDGLCKHIMVQGVCTKCGYVCTHNIVNCVCILCGMEVHSYKGCQCTVCGIGAHDWAEIAPTCTESGSKVCKVCNVIETIPATGHSFTTVKEATCGADGEKKCSACDATEAIPATGAHEWTETAPTCVKEGSKQCKTCDAAEAIPATGVHVWTETAPTCTEAGSKQCETCDAEEIIPATGHAWTISKEATCGAAGEKQCSVCSATEEIPATGAHEWEGCICKVCALENHTLENCVCTVCGKTIHTFVDDICTVCGTEQILIKSFSVKGLDENNTLTVGAGLTHQIELDIQPAGAEFKATYTSSKASYVSVDENGLITGAAAGKSATITVSPASEEYDVEPVTFTVKVSAAPSKVSVAADKKTVGVGQTVALKVSHTKANAITQYSFSSSNSAVADLAKDANGNYILDANGNYIVETYAEGKANIVVMTHNGKKATCKLSVTAAPTQITLDQQLIEMVAGETASLTASITPNKSYFTAAWSSADETIATVADGKVVAVSEGETTIYAKTYNDLTAACTVKVFPGPTSIEVTEAALISVKQKFTPEVVLRTEDGEVFNGKYTISVDAKYKSYATLSGSTLTAKKATKEGQPVVLTIEAYGLKAECAVTIVAAPTKITVNPAKATLCAGETLPISVSHVKADAPTEYSFATSNKAIADFARDENGKLIVDENGNYVVETYKAGSATITVKTHNGKKATCKVTVQAVPETIKLNKTELDLIVGGAAKQKSATLKATIAPSKAYSAIEWVSDNENVATVENGKVTAVAKGETTIRAIGYGGIEATCTVRVCAPAVGIENPQDVIISVGQKFTPAVTLLDEEGDKAVGTYSLKSSNTKLLAASGTAITAKKKVTEPDAPVRVDVLINKKVVGSFNVTIVAAPSEVILRETEATMVVGGKKQLNAFTDAPANFTYTTSNKKVATVDENGMITAVATGTAKITAKTHNKKTATLTVTVVEAPIASVSLNSVQGGNLSPVWVSVAK